MKKKNLFFAIALFLLIVPMQKSIGESPCEKTYVSPPWNWWDPLFMEHSPGNCFAEGGALCGPIIQCVTGEEYCTPWQCNGTPEPN